MDAPRHNESYEDVPAEEAVTQSLELIRPIEIDPNDEDALALWAALSA